MVGRFAEQSALLCFFFGRCFFLDVYDSFLGFTFITCK
jgi:hypothetical protein